MPKKLLAITALTLIPLVLSISANPAFAAQYGDKTSLDFSRIAVGLASQPYSVKKDQPYSEANDPLFHNNGPETQSPQHGYFAVPLIVIGLAGILLYFSRNE